MDTALFEKNIAVIARNRPDIAEKIKAAAASPVYSGLEYAKTGHAVPIFQSKQALHSLYNPEKEAERLIQPYRDCGFMLFCGLGSGIHIRYFLNHNPHAVCALTDVDYPSLKCLLYLLDYTDIFSHNRVFLLSPCTSDMFTPDFIQTYTPAVHGSFNCLILRTWKLFFAEQTSSLLAQIEHNLTHIRADFSVQAHFGKIWMRNIFSNLQAAENLHPKLPKADTTRKAMILGAGPSLEKALDTLQEIRRRYVLFCTDTAFPAVSARGIIPEFFVSIDPQQISYAHIMHRFSPETIGIFDLCANAATVRHFSANGNPFFFTAGSHPLARYAAARSPIPPLNTASGTVAVTAYHAAQALGFSRIECAGIDFAYTNGQAYARGTYLTHLYASTALRIMPEETAFTKLMFRTEVQTTCTDKGITYTPPILESYRKAFLTDTKTHPRWTEEHFHVFPYTQFIHDFMKKKQVQDSAVLRTLLPYKAWYEQHRAAKFAGKELALDDISVYTTAKWEKRLQ